jgi:hypothetical protein
MYYFTNTAGYVIALNGNVLCADSEDMAEAVHANILEAMGDVWATFLIYYEENHEAVFPGMHKVDLTPAQAEIYNSLPCY